MKHLNVVGKFLISLCMICAVVACSDDDDDDKKPDSIIGEWQFDKFELQIEPSNSVIENAAKEIIDNLTDKDFTKNVASLNEDNTYTINSADGDKIDKGKYALDNDQLTLNPGKSGSVKLTIVSNSNGKLILDLDLKQLAGDYSELTEINLLKKANVRITYNAI